MLTATYNFVSLEDSRNNRENLSADQAHKSYRAHVAIFKSSKCYIECDGVEVDPMDL